MESLELHAIGRVIFDTFASLHSDSTIRQISSHEQSFRLWAHSLGLHQKGHASLDYRLRDAGAVRSLVGDVLGELRSHLENLLEISTGKRLPFEEDVDVDDEMDEEDETGDDEDGERVASLEAEDEEMEEAEHDEASSTSSSDARPGEVDFRLQSLGENLDALYSIAAKIRNPRYRPQRATEDLYKHVPADIRALFRKEREEAEVAIVSYVHRRVLLEAMGTEHEVLVTAHSSPDNWLIRRTGIANARRKQQFVYWRDHADRIARGPKDNAPPAAEDSIPHAQPADGLGGQGASQLGGTSVFKDQGVTSTLFEPIKSLATSATRLDGNAVRLDDLRSVISHDTRPSTAVNLKGEGVEWPPPPVQTESTRFFTYAWRVHLIHDLQPYHCTYKDCHDPNRTYGRHQDWVDHENLHLRVWHCQQHGLEFETQPEYIAHLEAQHAADPHTLSPELLASVVGPSLQPHRDCPFCPTSLADVPTMQQHVAYHLERLAQFALPPLNTDSAAGDADAQSGHSSDSNQVHRRGRQGSAEGDFNEIENGLFKTWVADPPEEIFRIQENPPVNYGESNLWLGDRSWASIDDWVEHCAEEHVGDPEQSYVQMEYHRRRPNDPAPEDLTDSKTPAAPTEAYFPYLEHLDLRSNFASRGDASKTRYHTQPKIYHDASTSPMDTHLNVPNFR
ncbi:hypothetical protein F5X68DRAFT_262809 [Plectosphaerella plurivora]|uniref:C2H2-type domain-containing protein n=1 Tax=Plectosphaerella plurivora TaxID=936078 RepID=A0A9P8V8D2_9PEZI|nr:hypothetical protein F5X68DRAFT_262809 [Plectosphaerella plurivora]